MTRNNTPITEYGLSGGVNTGISYDIEFEGWEAAIAAGANLDELEKWDSGGYPRKFMARVIAWYRNHSMVLSHTEDAKSAKLK